MYEQSKVIDNLKVNSSIEINYVMLPDGHEYIICGKDAYQDCSLQIMHAVGCSKCKEEKKESII